MLNESKFVRVEGIAIESDVLDEIRWLIDWKSNDIYEQSRDTTYYEKYPEELEELQALGNAMECANQFMFDLINKLGYKKDRL